MKRHLARALGTLLIAGLLFSGGIAAADTPGCTSMSEFNNMDRGLSVPQVAARFDTNGWYIATSGDRFRRGYEPCWTDSRKVVVIYSLTTGFSVDWDIRDA